MHPCIVKMHHRLSLIIIAKGILLMLILQIFVQRASCYDFKLKVPLTKSTDVIYHLSVNVLSKITSGSNSAVQIKIHNDLISERKIPRL